MKRSSFVLLSAVALILWLTAPARALPILVDFTVNYYPPNPCSETELGDLSTSTLQGAMTMYYQTVRNGDLLLPNPGPPDAPVVACGESQSRQFSFDTGTFDSAALYISFEGSVFIPSPGSSEALVYAMLVPDPGPPEEPADAPLLFLGNIVSGESLMSEFPLFAFASPGYEVGSIGVNAHVVPEPSGLLIFVSAWGVLILLCRCSRQHARRRAPMRMTAYASGLTMPPHVGLDESLPGQGTFASSRTMCFRKGATARTTAGATICLILSSLYKPITRHFVRRPGEGRDLYMLWFDGMATRRGDPAANTCRKSYITFQRG